mmetsp:Transcript_20196/g.56158  ORF Transcript_20196/g.56158 Transcript_20196/m.56158 type:complete len:192 (+) Transcript_20196:1127-1702(+)
MQAQSLQTHLDSIPRSGSTLIKTAENHSFRFFETQSSYFLRDLSLLEAWLGGCWWLQRFCTLDGYWVLNGPDSQTSFRRMDSLFCGARERISLLDRSIVHTEREPKRLTFFIFERMGKISLATHIENIFNPQVIQLCHRCATQSLDRWTMKWKRIKYWSQAYFTVQTGSCVTEVIVPKSTRQPILSELFAQ